MLAPQWAVVALLALLTLAAVEDAARLRISNLISIAVLLLGVVTAIMIGPRLSLWENLLVFVIALTVGTFMFSAGKMGGGDIKLFAAVSLWFDLGGALRLLIAVAIAGGILAFFIIALRMMNWSEGARERAVVLRAKGGIPYGVAIAAGAALALLMAQSAAGSADPLHNWNALPRAR